MQVLDFTSFLFTSGSDCIYYIKIEMDHIIFMQTPANCDY